jgi:hypothetical protein
MAEVEPETTTIKVTKTLRDVLRDLGTKNQTIEQILWGLLDSPEVKTLRKKRHLPNIDDSLEDDEREAKNIAAAKRTLEQTNAKLGALHNMIAQIRKSREMEKDAAKLVRMDLEEKELLTQSALLGAQRDHLTGLVARESGLLLKKKRLAILKPLLAQFREGENLPACHGCDESESVRLTEGVPQPRFAIPSHEAGWRTVEVPPILTFTCDGCNLRFEEILDEVSSTLQPRFPR